MKWRTLATRLEGDGTLTRIQLRSGDTPKSRVQVCPSRLLSYIPLAWSTLPVELGEAFRASLLFNAPQRLVYFPKRDPEGRDPFALSSTATLRPGCSYLPLLHSAQDRFIASMYSQVRDIGDGRSEVWDPDRAQWRPIDTFFYEGAQSGLLTSQ